MPTQHYTEDEYLSQIREAVEGDAANAVRGIVATAGTSGATCARYRRIEQEQWRFVRLFQWLIFGLSAVAGIAVVVTIVLALTGQGWSAALSGATAVVSGALIGFPVRQRGDARRQHKAALRALTEAGC